MPTSISITMKGSISRWDTKLRQKYIFKEQEADSSFMAYDGVTHSQGLPAMLRERAAVRRWLWVTPDSGQFGTFKNNKTAPGCNLILMKNCLDKWVHFR
jgi:hypothetical protein